MADLGPEIRNSVTLYTSYPPEDPVAMPFYLGAQGPGVSFDLLDTALDAAGVRPGQVIFDGEEGEAPRGVRFLDVCKEKALGLAAIVADNLQVTDITVRGIVFGGPEEAHAEGSLVIQASKVPHRRP